MIYNDIIWYPHLESNQDLSLRRALFYPLNYGDFEFSAYLLVKYYVLAETGFKPSSVFIFALQNRLVEY